MDRAALMLHSFSFTTGNEAGVEDLFWKCPFQKVLGFTSENFWWRCPACTCIGMSVTQRDPNQDFVPQNRVLSHLRGLLGDFWLCDILLNNVYSSDCISGLLLLQ